MQDSAVAHIAHDYTNALWKVFGEYMLQSMIVAF
jgi:hypothetical protein